MCMREREIMYERERNRARKRIVHETENSV